MIITNKVLKASVLTSLVVALFSCSAFASDLGQEITYSTPKSTITPDGTITAAEKAGQLEIVLDYSSPDFAALNPPNRGGVFGICSDTNDCTTERASFIAYLSWDDEFFNWSVDVNDTSPRYSSGSGNFDHNGQDTFQPFFDPFNQHDPGLNHIYDLVVDTDLFAQNQEGMTGSGIDLYRRNPANDNATSRLTQAQYDGLLDCGTPATGCLAGTKKIVSPTEEAGYVLELAIPWDVVMADLSGLDPNGVRPGTIVNGDPNYAPSVGDEHGFGMIVPNYRGKAGGAQELDAFFTDFPLDDFSSAHMNTVVFTPPVVGGPVNTTWASSDSGSWHVASNWTGGIPNGNNDKAIFGDAISSPRVVTTDTDVTVRRIQFDHSVSYAIAGHETIIMESGSVAEGSNARIDVDQGDHQFQAPVKLNRPTDVDVAELAMLTFNGALDLNSNTLTKSGAGEMAINNDLVLGGGGMVVNAQGSLSGTGTVGGSVENSGGTVAPGNSPGVLSITGNYTQGSGGTLNIEIDGVAGPGEGGHDQLDVGGDAALDGTLDIQTDAGFTPGVGAMPGMVGDSFVILTAASRTGEFSTVNGRHAGGGKFYKVGYNPTNVSLGAFQAAAGDADGDLDVDITDFNTLAGNFDPSPVPGVVWTDADFDADTDVDITDFNFLAANFAPDGYGASAVPEPSSLLLTLLGLILLTGVRGRQAINEHLAHPQGRG